MLFCITDHTQSVSRVILKYKYSFMSSIFNDKRVNKKYLQHLNSKIMHYFIARKLIMNHQSFHSTIMCANLGSTYSHLKTRSKSEVVRSGNQFKFSEDVNIQNHSKNIRNTVALICIV